MEERITIEVSPRELMLMTEAINATMATITEALNKHRNHKDYSMDKLFAIMEMYATTGDLWSKLHKAAGMTQEEISEYLAEQEI